MHVDLVVDAEECTPERLDGVMQGRFEFVGQSHTLPDPIDWLHNPSVDVEWHILLHKFYYAAGLGQRWRNTGDEAVARRWASLLDGWMQQVPAGFIAADVTGRRVQNWIYSLQAFVCTGGALAAPVDPAFFRRLLLSLHEQVEYLCAHLTPKRNHRTLELYAIFLAGVALPEMAQAAHWRRFAMEQTLVNMQQDLLPDGVHCELSSDYHHLAVRNWLHVRTLAARHGVPVPALMDRLLERALHFSLHVHQPQGVVPSLSDGDVRGFLPLLDQGAALYGRSDMRWVASQGRQGTPPAQTLAVFADSGYCVLRSGWGHGAHDFARAQHLVFDCGPLGEGNHGHFDCLSFELAAGGQALVVDPGRYTYSEAGSTNWRLHFRGTAAHNTVCVDGQNQTRYLPKPIREASRHASGSVRHKISGPAPVAVLQQAMQADDLQLVQGQATSAAYDAVHGRAIVRLGAMWIVSDWLRAPTPHDYVLRMQLSAQAQGRTVLHRGAQLRIDSPGLALLQPLREGQHTQLDAGWVSPRYGHKDPAPALRCQAHGAHADFDTVLLPGGETDPTLQLHDLPVPGATAPALRIEHTVDGHPVWDTWLHARDAASATWQWDGFVAHGPWLLLRQWLARGTLQAWGPAGAQLQHQGRAVALVHALPVAAA